MSTAPTKQTTTLLPSGLLIAALVLLFTGERIIGDGSLRTVMDVGGAVLVALALAIRARALGGAVGDMRGVEVRILGGYAGVIAALACYALSTDAAIEKLGLEQAAAERWAGVFSVLWPVVLLVSGCALFFMELAYNRMPIARSVELRRIRTASHAGLTLALSAVFVMSLNFVASERDVRKDVSYFKTTRPSEGTLRMLRKLDKPLHIKLFYRRSNDVLVQLEPYFKELAAASEMVRYEVVDFALEPKLARDHKVRDNGHVLLLQQKPADPATTPPAPLRDQAAPPEDEEPEYKAESFKVGTELTLARRTLKKLDSEFQQRFRKLAQPERALHLTVGHGERNAEGSDVAREDGTRVLTEVLKRLNLSSEKLGLSQGLGSAVPDGASAVAIVGPTEKFMPAEVDTLLAYVRKGGRLFLMLEPDRDVGLQPLLHGLGLELKPGVLMSEKHHMRRTAQASDRAIVFSNTYSAHPSVTTVSRHSREVATIFVGGGALDRRRVEGGKAQPSVTFPVQSASDFWLDRNGNFARDNGLGEVNRSENMVAAVTVPVASASGEGGAQGDDPIEGRVVVVADGDFMTDKVATNNGNMLLFVDALAWLIGNEELSGEVSSEEDIPIEHSRDEDKIWFYATTFAVPVPVLLLGLWIARRRQRRTEAKS